MASFKDFREIAAWRLAHLMHLRVDVFLACPAFRSHFTHCEELAAAARLAPFNIAEGHARLKHRDFAGFVRTARGHEKDVLRHLSAAHEQLLITTDELIINRNLARRAIRAASGLIRYLESTPDTTREQRRAESKRRSDQPPEARIPPPLTIGGGEHQHHGANPRDDRHHRVTRRRLA